jgi:hypothetical protein
MQQVQQHHTTAVWLPHAADTYRWLYALASISVVSTEL